MNGRLTTFRGWRGATPNLSAAERRLRFGSLPPDYQADAWAQVRERVAHDRIEERFWAGENWPEPKAPPKPRLQIVSTARRNGRECDDVLDQIPPRTYFEALTGEHVPAHGRVCCPIAGHDDRNPSCRVYAEPGRGWWCPVCGTGGSAIDLAAHLTGIEPRGDGFWRLRQLVAEHVLGEVVA